MKKKTTLKKKKTFELPLVVVVAVLAIGLLGYLSGRIVLAAEPHPVHWLSGLVGMAVGLIFGWVWFLWKGDIA